MLAPVPIQSAEYFRDRADYFRGRAAEMRRAAMLAASDDLAALYARSALNWDELAERAEGGRNH